MFSFLSTNSQPHFETTFLLNLERAPTNSSDHRKYWWGNCKIL